MQSDNVNTNLSATDNTSKAPIENFALKPELNLSSLCSQGSRPSDLTSGTPSTASQFLPDASFLNLEKDVSALASGGNPKMEMTDQMRQTVKQDLSAIDLDLKALGQQFAGLESYLHGFESGPSTAAAPYTDSTIAAMTDPASWQGTDVMAAQVLTDAHGQMSPGGFAQFEAITAADTKMMGAFPDDPTLLASALDQFQKQGGSASDVSALKQLIGTPPVGDQPAPAVPVADPPAPAVPPADQPTPAVPVADLPTPTTSPVGSAAIGGWTADFTNAQTAKSVLDKVAPVQWGNVSVDANGGIDIAATPGQPNVAQTGFMTPDSAAGDSFGYGTYSFSFAAKSQGGDNGATDGQGAGVYAALWPADNKWPGQEVDAWENWKGQQIATNHWQGAGNSNGFTSHDINGIDPTQENTYTIKWAPDASGTPSLTEWVNSGGVGGGPLTEIYQTNHNVEADAAHGGVNAAPGFGAESSQDGTAGSVATVCGMTYTPLA
jgi:hypothetical protein